MRKLEDLLNIQLDKVLEQLEFRIALDENLKKQTFDLVFKNSKLLIQFNKFLGTKTGQSWLNSGIGQRFREWQNS